MTATEDVAKYFEACGYRPDDQISIVTRAGADGPLHWTFVSVKDAPRQIVSRARINCWFSANPMREPAPRRDEEGNVIRSRGTTDDVVAVRALWADLDVKPGGMPSKKAAFAVIRDLTEMLGCKPVAMVSSGHGYQPRWRLDPDGIDLHTPARFAPVIERFGRLVQKVAERHGGKADPVYDMPRIIRAPFTTNIKSGMEPVETGMMVWDDGGVVSLEKLLEVLDAYVVEEPPTPSAAADTETRNVGTERGNAYTKAAMEAIKTELAEIATWPAGQTDERGRGWEKIQADAAYRLASLAKADWNTLDVAQAKNFFIVSCPKDEHWTVRKVTGKWNAQVKRAEAAPAPADILDDPLAGGARPHHSAPAGAGASEGDDSPAGAPRGELGDDSPAAPDPGGAADPEAPAPAEALSWRKFTWDDDGNADRLATRFADQLRHVPALKRWMWYEDGAWRESETGGERAARELFRELYKLEGPLYSDVLVREGRKETSDRIKFGDWVDDQRSATRMRAAAQVLKFSEQLDVPPTIFDAHPFLLNCPNGVVDLQTGELLEHDHRLMLRRQIAVKYQPDAQAPKWEAYLEQAMPSPDMRDYLQRIIGYTITGSTSQQAVFFHVGLSGAGKSLFLEVVAALLGEGLANALPAATLLNKKQEQHPTDIADMDGKRYIYLDETPEGARLDEALIKRLSGESTIKARGMGQDFRSLQMVGKIHLATNHDPHISDDPAVHRRLHYIPWRNVLPEDQRDDTLKGQIIREELEGVLAWAVRGTQRWRKDRLSRPMEAEMARAVYIASEDEFGHFMEEELILGAESFTAFKEAYRRYVQWCEGFRMKPMGSKSFTQKLVARGVKQVRRKEARGFEMALTVPRWVQDPLG